MLASFLRELEADYADARLELLRPASDIPEAEARLDALCRHAVAVRGCAAEIEEQAAYRRYVEAFAEAAGTDLDAARSGFETPGGKGMLALGVAGGMLAIEGHAHAADGADLIGDVASHGVDAVDVVEGLATIGLSIAMSWAVQLFFRARNDAKRARVAWLTERAYLKGRLAYALMGADGMEAAADAVRRLREADTAAAEGA